MALVTATTRPLHGRTRPLHVVHDLAVFAAALVAAALVATQCRKPKWLLGRLYLWLMNRTHSRLTSWALSHLSIGPKDAILDVGCGGGRTVRSLSTAAPEGRVTGIDYSPQSVAASRRFNGDLIAAGNVDIVAGSVSSLPFQDETFDLVTAVETHYYWPDPARDFARVLRVLKPTGTFLIVAEAHRRSERDFVMPLVMKLLGGSCPSAAQLKQQLAAAGFSSIEMFEDRRKGWLAITARRTAL